MGWTPIVGRRFSAAELEAHVRGLVFGAWRPKFVVVHNTGVPSVAQRPHGFTAAHMQNLVSYYRDQQRWSAGPHAFVDQNGIWIFTPLTAPGVHSPSWNKLSWGVETLGNYETERFEDPIRENLLSCLTTLHDVMGFAPETLRLHREDTATTHACPGKNLKKAELVQELVARLDARRLASEALLASTGAASPTEVDS